MGKTNILSRYIHNKFTTQTINTSIAEFYSKYIVHESSNVKVQFWDTAGQQLFKSMSNIFYRNCHGVVLCYDISNRKSFDDVERWSSELAANMDAVPILLLGNKSDLEAERCVRQEEGVRYAQKHGYYFMRFLHSKMKAVLTQR